MRVTLDQVKTLSYDDGYNMFFCSVFVMVNLHASVAVTVRPVITFSDCLLAALI